MKKTIIFTDLDATLLEGAPEADSSAPAHRQELVGIFDAALAAVDPYYAVLKAVHIIRPHHRGRGWQGHGAHGIGY
jgi:hypothetical protein